MTGKSVTGDQKHGPSSHYSVNPKLIRKKKKSLLRLGRDCLCVWKHLLCKWEGLMLIPQDPRQSLIPSMIIVPQCSSRDTEGRDRGSQAANLASTAGEQERCCQERSRQQRLAHLRLTSDLCTHVHHVRCVPTVTYMNAHPDVHTLHTQTTQTINNWIKKITFKKTTQMCFSFLKTIRES